MNKEISMRLSIEEWKRQLPRLGTALVLDMLDSQGYRHQALQPGVVARTTPGVVVGVAKTLLWLDFAHDDPSTYELELKAVDSVRPDELLVCATGNSARSGIWGELLTTAARQRGAAGIVTDGAIRDTAQIEAMHFPCFSRYVSPYDSFNRQKVVAYDVRVEVDQVTIEPGDVIVGDRDGVAVVPSKVAVRTLELALEKAGKEDLFRESVQRGDSLLAAYQKYKVL